MIVTHGSPDFPALPSPKLGEDNPARSTSSLNPP